MYDVIKLLHQALMFSYEHANHLLYSWTKDKCVKYPQYSFPEGILKSLGEDHTFLQVLQQIYAKITTLNFTNDNIGLIDQAQLKGQYSNHNNSDQTLSESKVIEIC